MVDPAIAGAVGTALAVGVAAGYAYLSGNDADVDLDDDGNAEFEFEGDETVEDPAYKGSDDSEVRESVEQAEDPTPEEVKNKSMTDVTGIGPTRAEKLGKAGYPSPKDLYYASDENLKDVNGIGSFVVGQIRDDIGSVDEGNSEKSDESGGKSDEEASENSQD